MRIFPQNFTLTATYSEGRGLAQNKHFSLGAPTTQHL